MKFNNDIQEIFRIVPNIRLVGGCVRDHILGIEPKDYDFSTPYKCEEIIELFEKENYEVVPSGLQHGTVTVIINHTPYEITTLRKDVKTDGRHAEVEFVTDWIEDASRRDFTFNALYMDKDKIIYDYFNGVDDLKNNRIKFINDSRKRIEEDYLRILRYFRFMSRFNSYNYKPYDFDVIKELSPNINSLSKERIYSEIIKIFNSNNPWIVIEYMNQTNISKEIFGIDIPLPTNKVKVNYLTILALISKYTSLENYSHIMSKYDKKIISKITNGYYVLPWDLNDIKIQKLIQVMDKDEIEYRLMYTSLYIDFNPTLLIESVRNTDKLKFPISGNDLIQYGLSGIELGEKLKYLKNIWMDSNFEYNKDQLMDFYHECK